MHERFAVIFRDGGTEAAGGLDVEGDWLRLHGRSARGDLEVEIPFAELAAVRVGRRPNERLNGYATLILERTNLAPVQVAPLGLALLPEISALLVSLSNCAAGDVLAMSVPLKPGCLGRAQKLLAKGPPVDPASLGLTGHEVYLHEDEAVFVFRGTNARTRVSEAIRQPAVWRAGLAWQRCFAGTPRIVDAAELSLDPDPAYRWVGPEQPRP
jgi:hypothetical protein